MTPPSTPTGHGTGERADGTSRDPEAGEERAEERGEERTVERGWLPAVAPGDAGMPRTGESLRPLDDGELLVGTDPRVLVVRPRAGHPETIRVRVGDHVFEGDVEHLERVGTDSPRIADWEVTEITPMAVRARNVRSGDDIEWERATFERGLASGTYATALTDFETVTVSRVGHWAVYEAVDPGSATPAGDHERVAGEPYVSVVAVGDNGRTYRRRYRLLDPGTAEVELLRADDPRVGHAPAVARRLEARVQDALRAEGYDVVVPEE